ncbi:Cro/Cl family transcriptional regulator (fragment) [Syntrophobacter sp. SbD1]
MELREARFRKKMTQYDLWLLTGVSAPRISLAERGFAVLRKREREAIAKALGMPVESIHFCSPVAGGANENR